MFSISNLKVFKSSKKSEELRLVGNELFKAKKFFDSLLHYNKSLLFAKYSEEKSLIFSNRSAVYFQMKDYDHCLKNIKLARESGYPSEKLETLRIRERKCLELLKVPKPADEIFKLSYPSNQICPFVADCLELRHSQKMGRCIFTNRDLQAGDFIAIEEPFFKTVEDSCSHHRCFNCLKHCKLNLLPNANCTNAMFCSSECEETASNNFFQAGLDCGLQDFTSRILFESLSICSGSFEKLDQLMKSEKKVTIFDLDLRNTSTSNGFRLLQAFNSLQQGPVSSEMEFIEDHAVYNILETEYEKQVAKRFMQRVYRIQATNCLGLDWLNPQKKGHEDDKEVLEKTDVGSAILLFGSFFNHSCNHNIDRIAVENKIVFYARKPISKGSQLFINYGPFYAQMPSDERQKILKERYGFDCTCEACENVEGYPFLYDHEVYRMQAKVLDEISGSKDHAQEFKKTCEALTTTRNDMRSIKCLELMLKNMYLLVLMAKSEPLIF